jgi:hypothetical protein
MIVYWPGWSAGLQTGVPKKRSLFLRLVLSQRDSVINSITCGRGRPQDSRPGGRRYNLAVTKSRRYGTSGARKMENGNDARARSPCR